MAVSVGVAATIWCQGLPAGKEQQASQLTSSRSAVMRCGDTSAP